MSEKISIKVVVAGRTYPISVFKGEEEKVFSAADDINKSIKFLQENYAVRDMQDLLAMTALQLATKKGDNNSSTIERTNTKTMDSEAKNRLNEIGSQLNELLQLIEKTN